MTAVLILPAAKRRIVRRGSCASPALADLYRRDHLRGDPAVEPRTYSPDGRFGPHLSFVADRRALCGHVAALSLAHDRRLARRRRWKASGERASKRGGADFAAVDGPAALPHGLIGDHIRDLALKARTQGRGRLDQTLLLRSLADRLRGSNGFGAFASDTLMKLGLLGTIIGFIIMLAPIAGLDASDKSMMKSSMGLMSDGMAVAMYTTLAGLVGSILLKIQYYMLDSATAKVFSRAVTLTETRVVPALERAHGLGTRA